MKKIKVEFERLPDYGDHMTIENFIQNCKVGMFIDYDGYGYLATKDRRSDIIISPSKIKKVGIPKWATHVLWYNR